jgi:hypothetical protein
MSTIPDIMITERAVDCGLGGATANFMVRAPLQQAVPPAPGGGEEPHAELRILICAGATVYLQDGSVSGAPTELPPGAELRVGLTRAGCLDLGAGALEVAGYLRNAYPPVP